MDAPLSKLSRGAAAKNRFMDRWIDLSENWTRGGWQKLRLGKSPSSSLYANARLPILHHVMNE